MKKLFTTVLTLFTALTLAACGKNPGGSGEEFIPSLDTNTECNIKIVGDYDSFPELLDEFKEFRHYYPNVHLSYSKITGEYIEMIATVLEGNEKPNIFFAFTWMLENEKYNSVVSHMEDLSDPKLKINLSCIRSGLISSGNNLMVPLFGRSYGMLVNNSLFEKENLKVPSNFTELLSVCESFKTKGYASPMMGYSLEASNSLMNTIAYPGVVASLANNPEAIEKANNLDSQAGEYTRSALSAVDELAKAGAFNLTECNKMANNYDAVLLRFLEGDVPMMICADDTPSGAKKREARSQAFIDHPFSYSYAPIPLGNNGGYFIDNPSKLLSVNKSCENLDMTNEFMRFLVSTKELNALATKKNLISSTKDFSFDSIYAPFGQVPADRTFSPEGLGFKDAIKVQVRKAAYKVGIGEITVDQAVKQYGSF